MTNSPAISLQSSLGQLPVILLIFLSAMSLFVYLLPSIVAVSRRHYNATAIVVLNIILGWTFLGWAVALVWSFTKTAYHSVSRSAAENTTLRDTAQLKKPSVICSVNYFSIVAVVIIIASGGVVVILQEWHAQHAVSRDTWIFVSSFFLVLTLPILGPFALFTRLWLYEDHLEYRTGWGRTITIAYIDVSGLERDAQFSHIFLKLKNGRTRRLYFLSNLGVACEFIHRQVALTQTGDSSSH